MPRILTLLAVLSLVFLSCQKELSESKDQSVPKPANAYISLEEFFEKNTAKLQEFTVAANIGGMCNGSEGGKFYFSNDAFVDKNGQPATGDIRIKIREIYKPADMILSNMPTMSNGKPLISGGEFHISATSKGEELSLKKGKSVRVDLPGQSLDGMQVFNGQPAANGQVNWVVNTNPANVVRRRDSLNTGQGFGYSLFCDSIRWINCDKFITDPLIAATFTPGNCPDVDSTGLFIHLTGRNSVLRIGTDNLGDFSSDKLIATPVTVVAICYREKKILASIQTLTLTNKLVKALQFREMSEDELKKALADLK